MNLKGKVITQSGTPIVGARIEIFDGETQIAGVTSADDGEFEFSNDTPCAGRVLKFIIKKEGFYTLTESVHAQQDSVTTTHRLTSPPPPPPPKVPWVYIALAAAVVLIIILSVKSCDKRPRRHGGASNGPPVAGAVAQTTFDVILASVPPDKKIAVIKDLRRVKRLGLAEAKALVEGAPKPVLEGVSKANAEAAQKILEAAGAKVELKQTSK